MRTDHRNSCPLSSDGRTTIQWMRPFLSSIPVSERFQSSLISTDSRYPYGLSGRPYRGRGQKAPPNQSIHVSNVIYRDISPDFLRAPKACVPHMKERSRFTAMAMVWHKRAWTSLFWASFRLAGYLDPEEPFRPNSKSAIKKAAFPSRTYLKCFRYSVTEGIDVYVRL